MSHTSNSTAAAQLADLMAGLQKSPTSAGAHALDAILTIADQQGGAEAAAQAGRIADCCSDLAANLSRQTTSR